MYEDLKGKTALITGAGRPLGIGFGMAHELAANGMNVLLADIAPPPERGEDLTVSCAQKLREEFGIKAVPLELNVTDQSQIDAAVRATETLSGELHVLVNNAGSGYGSLLKTGECDTDRWARVIDINLMGPFRLIKAFLPIMKRGASIINVASRAGKRPMPRNSSYSASKAALIMLTKSVAVEYAENGIRCNAICPGQVLTEMNLARYEQEARAMGISREKRMAEMMKTVPLGRIAEPAEIGRLTAFLASNQSGYMTGQAINITGGQLVEL